LSHSHGHIIYNTRSCVTLELRVGQFITLHNRPIVNKYIIILKYFTK